MDAFCAEPHTNAFSAVQRMVAIRQTDRNKCKRQETG